MWTIWLKEWGSGGEEVLAESLAWRCLRDMKWTAGSGRVWGLEEGECLVEGGRYVPGEGMSEPVCTA